MSDNLQKLISHPLCTWNGWVIYYWDHGFSCILYDKEPKKLYYREEFDGWECNGNEQVDPYFLKACGIDVKFDVTDEEGQKFYYGEDCYHGMHPPIQISLTLPEPLLDQLKLGSSCKKS